MNDIQVCFSISDLKGDYSKYLGVAILSLLKNTTSSIHIHIIHDNSLSQENIDRFEVLGREYNQKISFYQLDLSILNSFKNQVKNYTLGTLFRFYIIDILPNYIKRIIYLDDDIIVNLDIKELWEINLNENVIAACKDPGVFFARSKPAPCVSGEVALNEYFNAGVLVLNLDKIRQEKGFARKCINLLKNNFQYTLVDQDVFNVVFNGKVEFLPNMYNSFSRYIRKRSEKKMKCICHFSGDYVKVNSSYWVDRLFISYLTESPWGGTVDFCCYFLRYIYSQNDRIKGMQHFIGKILDLNIKIYIWGAKSKYVEKINEFWKINNRIFAYVDSDEKNIGEMIGGKKIYSPNVLKRENDDFFVVVASMRYYDEIKNELEGLGKVEISDFIDAKVLIDAED